MMEPSPIRDHDRTAESGGAVMAHARFRRGLAGSLTWVDLIRECGAISPGMFTSGHTSGPWWAGGDAEEYSDARIIHRPDGTVSIVSLTDEGAATIAEAARRLNVYVG